MFEIKTPFDTVLQASKCSTVLPQWDNFRMFKWADSIQCPEIMIKQIKELLQVA